MGLYNFSRIVAAVDTKRGYVDICAMDAWYSKSLDRRRPKTACLRRGRKIIYSYYTRCALIRDRQPTSWDNFARPAKAEATCIWKG